MMQPVHVVAAEGDVHAVAGVREFRDARPACLRNPGNLPQIRNAGVIHISPVREQAGPVPSRIPLKPSAKIVDLSARPVPLVSSNANAIVCSAYLAITLPKMLLECWPADLRPSAARSSSSQCMWRAVVFHPLVLPKGFADKDRPCSSMQKATGLASIGSAANSSPFSPAGTRNVAIAALTFVGPAQYCLVRRRDDSRRICRQSSFRRPLRTDPSQTGFAASCEKAFVGVGTGKNQQVTRRIREEASGAGLRSESVSRCTARTSIRR